MWSLAEAQAGAPGLRTGWQGAPCAGGTCAEPAHGISAPWAKQNMREKTALWEMPWFHWAPPLGEFRGTKHPPAPGKAAMPPCCCCFCPWPCYTETMLCPWPTSGLWLFSLYLYLLPAARAAQLLSPRCRAPCRAKEQAQREAPVTTTSLNPPPKAIASAIGVQDGLCLLVCMQRPGGGRCLCSCTQAEVSLS